MNRRRLLTALGLSIVATPSLLSCSDSGPSDDESKEDTANGDQIDLLFVHSAGETTLADGVLRLGDVSTSTIYFSDRPERIAGHLSTEEFVANWGHGGDHSFASDPPNATLSILSGPMPQEVVVVLTSPRLDDGVLTYNVEVLEGDASAVGDASALFIDVIGRPLTPLSIAGGRRRVRRRTRRRND